MKKLRWMLLRKKLRCDTNIKKRIWHVVFYKAKIFVKRSTLESSYIRTLRNQVNLCVFLPMYLSFYTLDVEQTRHSCCPDLK